jgi:tetrahydromethanopterin S-methyltransferase subunit G
VPPRRACAADASEFEEKLAKADAACGLLKAMVAAMEKGECSALECVPLSKKMKAAEAELGLEVNDLDEQQAQSVYKTKSFGEHTPAQLHKKFKSYQRSTDDQIEKAKKAALLDQKAGAAFDADKATAGQVLDQAQRIQGQDLKAVKRMQRKVGEIEAVGAAAMEAVHGQTEQIAKMHTELEEIDSNLKLANGELTRYMRRIATDKIILMFVGLLVIGIAVIIVLHAFGFVDDEQVNAPDFVPTVDLNG